MLRKKTLTAKDENVSVKITVQVKTGKDITRDESAALMNNLTDASMASIKAAPFLLTALHAIKVK